MFKRLIFVTALASVFTTATAQDVRPVRMVQQLSVQEKIDKIRAENLVKDEMGKIKFLIKFKPTESVSMDKNNLRRKSSRLDEYMSDIGEPGVIDDKLMRNAEDRYEWAPKESIASLKYLAANYKIKADLVLVEIDKVVAAYLTEQQATELAKDDLIDSVNPDEVIVVSGIADGGDINQILSWGLMATNTSTMGSGGTAYVADLTLSNIAMADHPTITRIHENQSYFDLSRSFHPVYVTSIIGAKNNSQQARGISTGPIVHSSVLTIDVSGIAAAIEAAYVHAEANSRFSPLNLSLNSDDSNGFGNSTSYLHHLVSIASNRLMVTQSAGNNVSNACNHAFVPQGKTSASPHDGVMVVGAYDRDGNRAWIWPDEQFIGVIYQSRWVGGSNAGSCVDIWAPGKDIAVSTYLNGPYFNNSDQDYIYGIDYNVYSNVVNRGILMAAGGTSYAAPFVTGIAARLNLSNNIRPPQMESMLRATAAHTGGYDPVTGQAMMGVKYNASAAAYGIKYIKPAINLSQAEGAALTNGKFDTIAWNSGSNNGEFTFSATPLKLVRFTPRGPGDDGVLNYRIQVINSSTGNWFDIVSASTTTYDRVPVTVEIPASYQNYATYKIIFNKPNGGWIALSEFETYQ